MNCCSFLGDLTLLHKVIPNIRQSHSILPNSHPILPVQEVRRIRNPGVRRRDNFFLPTNLRLSVWEVE